MRLILKNSIHDKRVLIYLAIGIWGQQTRNNDSFKVKLSQEGHLLQICIAELYCKLLHCNSNNLAFFQP